MPVIDEIAIPDDDQFWNGNFYFLMMIFFDKKKEIHCLCRVKKQVTHDFFMKKKERKMDK